MAGILIRCAQQADADAVLPMNDAGAEPLCAMYNKSSEAAIWLALDRGTRKVTDGLAGLRVEHIEPREWKAFDSDGLLFKNMNSAADYEEAKAQNSDHAPNSMSDHYFEFRNVSKSFDDNDRSQGRELLRRQGRDGRDHGPQRRGEIGFAEVAARDFCSRTRGKSSWRART